MNRVEIQSRLSKEVLEGSLQKEIELFNNFLSQLMQFCPSIEYRIISDLPGELGIELFDEEEKVADIWRAEYKSKVTFSELQVHCKTNWKNAKILNVRDACRYVFNEIA